MHRTLIRREFTAMASAVCPGPGQRGCARRQRRHRDHGFRHLQAGRCRHPEPQSIDRQPDRHPLRFERGRAGVPSDGTNGAGLHSYGSASGDFGSRSSGNGTYEVTGGFKILETITNDTGSAASASFNFYITPGYLNNMIQNALAAGDFVNAGVSFDIKVNGSSIWTSQASLATNDQGATTFSKSGVGAGSTDFYVGSGTSYNIMGVTRAIDLGVLNAGESLNSATR